MPKRWASALSAVSEGISATETFELGRTALLTKGLKPQSYILASVQVAVERQVQGCFVALLARLHRHGEPQRLCHSKGALFACHDSFVLSLDARATLRLRSRFYHA